MDSTGKSTYWRASSIVALQLSTLFLKSVLLLTYQYGKMWTEVSYKTTSWLVQCRCKKYHALALKFILNFSRKKSNFTLNAFGVTGAIMGMTTPTDSFDQDYYYNYLMHMYFFLFGLETSTLNTRDLEVFSRFQYDFPYFRATSNDNFS